MIRALVQFLVALVVLFVVGYVVALIVGAFGLPPVIATVAWLILGLMALLYLLDAFGVVDAGGWWRRPPP